MLNGVAKIADLGISKLIKTSGMSTQIGTQFYLAPEVFNEEKYSAKADVWSFGITLLELSLGKRINSLMNGITPPALIQDFPFEGLLDKIKDLDMQELIRHMLKRKAEERLTSQEVLDWLNGKKMDKFQKYQRPQRLNTKSKNSKNESRTGIYIATTLAIAGCGYLFGFSKKTIGILSVLGALACWKLSD